jgi:RimJ/RimL family protein N-acetyltransferase
MLSKEKPPVETLVTNCNFTSKEELKKAMKEFLRKYGDELPEEAIEKAVSDDVINNWVTFCAPDNPGEIMAGVHYEHNDWYLCTIKNAAVREQDRGKGIGTEMYKQITKKANMDDCLVLAADVTYDNFPSRKPLEKIGFKPVNRFCWAPGKKPAEILHYVLSPAQGDACPPASRVTNK